MTDRTTKALLLAIAVGLWANLGMEWFRPVVVHAQDDSRIVRELRNIQSDVSGIGLGVNGIALGVCVNRKIC